MKQILLLITAVLGTTFYGQTAPIPLDIQKTVAFIYLADHPTNATPNGTGFLVLVHSENRTNLDFGYLVTARHVLRPSESNWWPAIYVRLNRHDGSSDQVPIPIITSGPQKNVFIHTDPSVDIAVVPFFPKPFTNYDCLFLPVEMITSASDFKDLEIHEGSDVFFTGMFVNHLGAKRNTPITRFGKVALMTDEKIDWVFGKTDLYLMEANSFPGNSGSPVFFQIGNERANGSLVIGRPVIKLAGVLSGGYLDIQPIKTLSVSTNQYVTPNIGISGVVPSYELKEILFSKELLEQRARN